MHWADKIADDIIKSGKYTPYWVDDMKTPSGYAHIGSLRGPLVHSVIYRALTDVGKSATLTFVFNDFDPADELPPEYKDKLQEYLGFPLKKVPSPDSKFTNLADYLAEDLKTTLRELGFEARFLSSYDLYQEGQFDEVIRLALDNAEKIQDIYHRVSGSEKKAKGWLPFQAVCQNCGKLGTTLVYGWDGQKVSYRCEHSLVSWASGCGFEGQVSPFGGTGKLPWKVDWSAHWKVIGVTIEGAGKDHASAGGSYDITMAICRDIFKYPEPFKLPYEFFLIGGRKMSSSKGLGLKSHDITKILPPEIARFLFTRTNYKEQINFDPLGTMAVPDLFDEYDRSWMAYHRTGDQNLARAFELSQIKALPKKNPDLIIARFRDIANDLQLPGGVGLEKRLAEGGRALTADERKIIEQRRKYAKYWLANYAPAEFKIEIQEKADLSQLDSEQIAYLKAVVKLAETEDNPEKLQTLLYNKAKEMNLATKKAFAAIYLSLLGQDHGPQAAWFLKEYRQGIIRLKQALK